jgi:hypothetical protein
MFSSRTVPRQHIYPRYSRLTSGSRVLRMPELDPSATMTMLALSASVIPLSTFSNLTSAWSPTSLTLVARAPERNVALPSECLSSGAIGTAAEVKPSKFARSTLMIKPQLVVTMVCPRCAFGFPSMFIIKPGGQVMVISRLTRSCLLRNASTAGPILIPAS